MSAVLEEPIKPAAAGAQSLGELVDFHSRSAFLDQGAPGGIQPDLPTERPLLCSCGGGATLMGFLDLGLCVMATHSTQELTRH